MTLQALAERLRGLAASVAPAPPPPPPPSSSSASAAPHHQAPLPASWMRQLRCAPRTLGLAVMRNSMGASLALLTGVLVIDTVMTDPSRRRSARSAAAAANAAAAAAPPQNNEPQPQPQQPQPPAAA